MKEAYERMLKLGYQMQHALSNAMVLCQSWGYNGFKRYYRYKNRHIHNYMLLLQNEMFDNHELVAELMHPALPAYIPDNIKEHSLWWYETMKEAVDECAKVNILLVQGSGYQSGVTKDFLCCLYKMKEKARRVRMRGVETNWTPHDLHMYDDRLHEKIKRKEEKEGYE